MLHWVGSALLAIQELNKTPCKTTLIYYNLFSRQLMYGTERQARFYFRYPWDMALNLHFVHTVISKTTL